MINPEYMSLAAHQHITNYLQGKSMEDEDLNAVLRLSQHLRVFGLLSAVGYLNQTNAQEGKVRLRTGPVWEALLGQMIDEEQPLKQKALMKAVVEMAQNQPNEYLLAWRRSLVLAQHWNFWARAYKK